MDGRGLLSRLDSGERSAGKDPSESIAAHLRVLLNTRTGECRTVPEFGIMDFSDWVHNFPGSITALQQSIRGTILQFEPRLKNVSVRYTPSEDPLSLRFEITGQPVDKSSRQTLRFRTQLSPGGRVEVW